MREVISVLVKANWAMPGSLENGHPIEEQFEL